MPVLQNPGLECSLQIKQLHVKIIEKEVGFLIYFIGCKINPKLKLYKFYASQYLPVKKFILYIY
jgi:hypothetical protein